MATMRVVQVSKPGGPFELVERPGDVVAVLGIGGLGHLAIQYAAKMGFHTVAIARGGDKARAEAQRIARACAP